MLKKKWIACIVFAVLIIWVFFALLIMFDSRCRYYLVLVNKENKIPKRLEKSLDLDQVENAYWEIIEVNKQALHAFQELKAYLWNIGIDIEIDSAYRSVLQQQEIRDSFEKEYGIDYTKQYVAVPGYSEHHTALAIDICIKKDGILIYENDDMLEEREIFSKIHQNLADYWFILRYPEWKESITGYWYEPWHLRYVWIDAAKKIYNQWLTLEEYYSNWYCEIKCWEGII